MSQRERRIDDEAIQALAQRVERLGLVRQPTIPHVHAAHPALDDVVQALVDDVAADAQLGHQRRRGPAQVVRCPTTTWKYESNELLHGEEVRVHADAGYTGVDKRAEIAKARAEGTIRTDIDWHVAAKRGLIKAMPEGSYKELTVLVERKKAQIRARVEHPFHVIKNLFGYKRVSYRGLSKNGARLYGQFALANLVLAKRRLLDDASQGIGAS